jgi:uncharacterized protein (DUF1015 family)
MAIIKPFRALRPKADLAKLVASRPYDVLNTDEARKEAQDNPYSFLHITKSEIDLPDGTDLHSRRVYEKAKDNLQIFCTEKILMREENPCYYIYQLTMGNRTQTGLVCISALDDYDRNIIKKHELTRPDKELDRINHIRTTGAQTGNVFLAYKPAARVDELMESWKKSHEATYDFVAADQIRHTVWVIDDPIRLRQITETFAHDVTCTYIADGHHRAASAAKVRAALDPASHDAAADFFLTTIFPSDQLHILEYNRLVKQIEPFSTDEFINRLEQDFFLQASAAPVSPSRLHEFGLYMEGKWYQLTTKEGTYPLDPIGVLDVSILQSQILDKLLGIQDPRTDRRIDFVGGIRGLKELEKRIDSGEMKAAFSLYPVSIQQLFDIADQGEVMPPKSTWFEPKLRDGLFTHLLK